MLHRAANRTVVLIEALEVFHYREASLRPVAVVVLGPEGANAFGLDGNPTEFDIDARTPLENLS
jgi:hypothetical protein